MSSIVVTKHPIEKLVNIAIIILAIAGAVICSLSQWNRYLANPIVISIERDYRNWDGVFPAITVCHDIRVDKVKANDYIFERWGVNDTDDKYNYYMKFIESVAYMTTGSFGDFEKFENDKSFHGINFLELAKSVHPPNDISLLLFDIERENYLHETVSEKGVCFSMNSINDAMATTDVSKRDSSKLITCSFKTNQCYFKFYIFNSRVSVAVHSSYELVTEATTFLTVEKINLVYTTYKTLATTVADGVRGLSKSQRKCHFYDETLPNMKFYSVTLCLQNCKAKIAIDLCKCKPYLYHSYPGKECDASGYVCLRDEGFPTKYNQKCVCPQTCTQLTYLRNIIKRSNWNKRHDITVVQKSSYRMEVTPTKLRIRREVLFTFDDLLVSFGGAITFFLGVSSLDFFKFLYKFAVKMGDLYQIWKKKK